MPKTIKELQSMMTGQLRKKGFYPTGEKEALLRLGEEVGEVFEAVREKWPKSKLELEVADVLWILLRYCEFKNIDLEKSFLRKWSINERRPIRKKGKNSR